MAHQQDAVPGGDTEEGDEPDDRRYAQTAATRRHHHETADQGQRQVHEDDQRVAMAAEGHDSVDLGRLDERDDGLEFG